jgi:hypothetical protein
LLPKACTSVSEPFTTPGLRSLKAFDEELVLITAKGVHDFWPSL